MTDPKVLEILVDYYYDDMTQTYKVCLSKGTHPADYDIVAGQDGQEIYVKPSAGNPNFLKFKANAEIQGICFIVNADATEPVKCDTKGPCGGPFSLVADFKPHSFETPEIENTYASSPEGYAFWFFFPNGAIDPQIYNHGQTVWPDDAPKRAGCLGLLGRLARGRW